MTDLKEFLQKLNKNLATLHTREAKYANTAPLSLPNQIEDYHSGMSRVSIISSKRAWPTSPARPTSFWSSTNLKSCSHYAKIK